ncbi:MAG: tripeptide aminopeptidase PepT, partial [Pirellulales bacterium]
VIRVSENPELNHLHGKTLVTTDGTTLLGSDDKSGVAVIMQLAATLMRNREIPTGEIKILFTCDEEIGQGIKHVDLSKLGATVCYTLDGAGQDEIDTETFSADMAIITFQGVNIHPSIGKGKMINAIRGASHFVDHLPREGMSPETTDGRQGFLHPYQIEGGVAEAKVKVLIRDFASEGLVAKGVILRDVAKTTEAAFPGLKVDVKIVKQYRNLADGLAKEPRAVSLAEEAHRRLGRTARKTIVRGGTDGSQLTEKGLPTPNLSTGEHNPHSPLEWTCLEEMVAACEVLVELSKCWGEQVEKA